LDKNRDDFLLIAPGLLLDIYEWSCRAAASWSQMEKLSPQARRNLEEVCLQAMKMHESEPNESWTPFVAEILQIIEKNLHMLKPSFSIFHLSSYLTWQNGFLD
jgi:hypothetical protein